MTDKANLEFEGEVRRIARELWPPASGGGSVLVDGQERDGVFESEEVVHVVEVTVSRSLDKAKQDAKKIFSLITKYRVEKPTKAVKGWFITREEPSPEQKAHITQKYGNDIVAQSIAQFRSRLLDTHQYLQTRANYPFGSMRDPGTGAAKFSEGKEFYVPLTMIRLEDSQSVNARELADGLLLGRRYVLLGDFGAGKSTTLREIYNLLAKQHRRGQIHVLPVFLNLRDHHGQSDPDEAIERHARAIGFAGTSQLVRAWRAGYVCLILDGFDELAAIGWTSQPRKLRELRFQSMKVLRNLVRQTPRTSGSPGLIVSGRRHYFDSLDELKRSISPDEPIELLELGTFTTEQIKEFLVKSGWRGGIPEWLPPRPLLLGYLASRGLLVQALEVPAGSGPAFAWHNLLDRVASREAEIPDIDGVTVRLIIERLASKARSKSDGLGPLLPTEVIDIFRQICHRDPDDRDTVMLHRLPGLGEPTEDGSRTFVDEDLAEVAKAGDVFKFILDPHQDDLDAGSWQYALAPLGHQAVAFRCNEAKAKPGLLLNACKKADQRSLSALCADIALTMLQLGFSVGRDSPLTVAGAAIHEVDLCDIPNCSGLKFRSCVVGSLELPPGDELSGYPHFEDCLIGQLDGRLGSQDVPEGLLDANCSVAGFGDNARTTAAILDLDLPIAVRVALTILKKLYVQAGTGRKENALHRGLNQNARAVVPDVLRILKSEGLAFAGKVGGQSLLFPDRQHRTRVNRLLAAPTGCKDPVLAKLAEL